MSDELTERIIGQEIIEKILSVNSVPSVAKKRNIDIW